jgi:hypothetical protein
MFCPNCKAEYLAGVAVCAECDVPLVDALPVIDHEKSEPTYVEVITYNAGDIALIKSILDDGEIEYQIEGEYFNSMLPLLQPVKILVPENKVEVAKEILKDFNLTYLGLHS